MPLENGGLTLGFVGSKVAKFTPEGIVDGFRHEDVVDFLDIRPSAWSGDEGRRKKYRCADRDTEKRQGSNQYDVDRLSEDVLRGRAFPFEIGDRHRRLCHQQDQGHCE